MKYSAVFSLIFVSIQNIGICQNTTFVDKDVELYTPQFNIKPMNIQENVILQPKNTKITSALDSIYILNKKLKYTEGYRILTYVGTDKTESYKVGERLYKIFSAVEVVYKQPTYKIYVGEFVDRLEAKEVLVKKIIKDFPSAIIIRDNILIVRPKE